MNILNGPVRLILLHAGKYDYAEVEIDAPLHLVGPNNVGKTSIIAALQFLYINEQRRMHFVRSLDETRRYYMPDPNSYILFECRTPSGFQVLGVHGLGPLKAYDFERFVYAGRFEREDFLDSERRILPADQVKAGLAVKGFTRLEARHLRAALTGIGDNRGVDLGLVPLRNRDSYMRFRTVFRNLLRLAHLRQEELKSLILDINTSDFQQREIDLERRYSDNYHRVKSDALELSELKALEPEIRLLVEQDGERRLLRTRLPVMWDRIGSCYSAREEEFQAARQALAREIEEISGKEEEMRERGRAVREELKDVTGRLAVLNENLLRLAREEGEFKGFIPEWAEKQRGFLEQEIEELGMRLRGAEQEPVDRIENRLGSDRRELSRHKALLTGIERAAYAWLSGRFTQDELEQLFRIVNPELLGISVDRDGIVIRDEKRLRAGLQSLLGSIRDGRFSGIGCDVMLSSVSCPDLAGYSDPDEIRKRIEELERAVERGSDLLEAARDAETLRQRLRERRQARDEIIRKIMAFEKYQAKCLEAERWREQRVELSSRESELAAEVEQTEKAMAELVTVRQQVDGKIESIGNGMERLRNLLAEISGMAPPVEWEAGEVEELPDVLEDLIRIYRREFEQEARLSLDVGRGLALIEKRTYGRYTADNESAMLEMLTEELEGLEEREKAVRELWTAIAVGLRSAFKGLGRDLETLKSRVNDMNRALKKVSVSNLARLRLQVAERPEWTRRIREIAHSEDMPLFADPVDTRGSLEGLGGLLSQHPRVELSDLFDLHFEVHGIDGEVRTYHHLENIESHGTTITIKVLVNLILLRGLLGRDSARIPFYLDEVSSLDHNNLTAIVRQAEILGFTPILASPEAMAVAENIYFITEQQGRVVIEPESSRLRLRLIQGQDDMEGDAQGGAGEASVHSGVAAGGSTQGMDMETDADPPGDQDYGQESAGDRHGNA